MRLSHPDHPVDVFDSIKKYNAEMKQARRHAAFLRLVQAVDVSVAESNSPNDPIAEITEFVDDQSNRGRDDLLTD